MSDIETLRRTRELLEVQKLYTNDDEGLLLLGEEVINRLIAGDNHLNEQQADILLFMKNGSRYRGIKANRGIGKTALVGIYSVWRLIHEPHTRVVVFSQTSKRATEISLWVIKILKGLAELSCMLPDKNNGDRSSITNGFELYGGLKGSDKSPSVASYSIESGAQGARADLIVADDVESLQNSRTADSRAWLEEVTKEFESINQNGDIVYLGTPQSINSIYNNLPRRGYQMRTWTARYPTRAEVPNYRGELSPWITNAMERDPTLQTGGGFSGDEGKPTCPSMFDEDNLLSKELSQGKAKFRLQYMLNTELMDSDTFPLKLSNLIVGDFKGKEVPIMPIWSNAPQNRATEFTATGTSAYNVLYNMAEVNGGYEYREMSRVIMYIDTAGGGKNGDATSYSIVGSLDGYLYVLDVGSTKGGYELDSLETLVLAAREHGVKEVFMEKNFGNGAHWHMLRPLFDELYPVDFPEENLVWESGQKELRIIDAIEPILSTNRLVISRSIIRRDKECTAIHSEESRASYSLFHQLSNITRDRGSLAHDDAVDSLAGAVRELTRDISFDVNKFVNERREKEALKIITGWSDVATRRKWLQSNQGMAIADTSPNSRKYDSRAFRRNSVIDWKGYR